MRVLVSGATGLVGKALCRALEEGKNDVTILTRSEGSQAPRVLWDPERGFLDVRLLEGFDGVVHLAGENIAGSRWTPLVKDRIRESRTRATGLLAQTLARLARPPKVLVSASAVGFYGHRGEETLTEKSLPGPGFLADVCRAWEAACAPAAVRGIRVVHARLGMVLSPKDGALKRMIQVFKWGVGGRIGSGRQWWSWVHIDDVAGALLHLLSTAAVSGPVNVVAPGAVTNAEFAATLGRVLRRPVLAPVPSFAARWVLGDMADAVLLASARVEPRVLASLGYEFKHPNLRSALSTARRPHPRRK